MRGGQKAEPKEQVLGGWMWRMALRPQAAGMG